LRILYTVFIYILHHQ